MFTWREQVGQKTDQATNMLFNKFYLADKFSRKGELLHMLGHLRNTTGVYDQD